MIIITEKLSKYINLNCMIRGCDNHDNTSDNRHTLDLIKTGMGKYNGKIPGNTSIQEGEKCTFLGTGHILKRILTIR